MNDLDRKSSFAFFEPSEFIGAWSAKTDSYASRLPARPRATLSPRLCALADAALAVSAVASIFAIPLLILLVSMR